MTERAYVLQFGAEVSRTLSVERRLRRKREILLPSDDWPSAEQQKFEDSLTSIGLNDPSGHVISKW